MQKSSPMEIHIKEKKTKMRKQNLNREMTINSLECSLSLSISISRTGHVQLLHCRDAELSTKKVKIKWMVGGLVGFIRIFLFSNSQPFTQNCISSSSSSFCWNWKSLRDTCKIVNINVVLLHIAMMVVVIESRELLFFPFTCTIRRMCVKPERNTQTCYLFVFHIYFFFFAFLHR